MPGAQHLVVAGATAMAGLLAVACSATESPPERSPFVEAIRVWHGDEVAELSDEDLTELATDLCASVEAERGQRLLHIIVDEWRSTLVTQGGYSQGLIDDLYATGIAFFCPEQWGPIDRSYKLKDT